MLGCIFFYGRYHASSYEIDEYPLDKGILTKPEQTKIDLITFASWIGFVVGYKAKKGQPEKYWFKFSNRKLMKKYKILLAKQSVL